ncbi:DNA-directed RNA polymerase I subunit RPA34 [Spirillospora sp. NPDC048823]|uniref:DNA-directed RNA polymerase I subunit RPA34 n=1 Tax=unclassified Spirillospora TaxID=2642701 RepID=UPI0037139D02
MAADDTSVKGTDFWAALGTEPETGKAPTLPDSRDKLVAGRPRKRSPRPAERPGPPAEEAGDRSSEKEPSRPSPRVTRHATVEFPAPGSTPGPEERVEQDESVKPVEQEERVEQDGSVKPVEQEERMEQDEREAPQPIRPVAARAAEAVAEPEGPQAPPDWVAAEEIARSLEPRLFEIWTEALARHTGGDEAMAGRVHDVLSGCHLLGELWRDESVDEVHVHGTEVTVCGRNGMHRVVGFPDLGTAQRAVEAFRTNQGTQGAVVARVGDAVVVSRTPAQVASADWLLAAGVLTEDQLSQVAMALRHMRTVTVTGPAARIVVRALASLIPAGSRVFLGPYVTLPAGCVTAASPMEADYVVGVRPGALAEDMATEGQVGALIANPATRVRAAIRLAVSGPSANPGEVSQIP